MDAIARMDCVTRRTGISLDSPKAFRDTVLAQIAAQVTRTMKRLNETRVLEVLRYANQDVAFTDKSGVPDTEVVRHHLLDLVLLLTLSLTRIEWIDAYASGEKGQAAVRDARHGRYDLTRGNEGGTSLRKEKEKKGLLVTDKREIGELLEKNRDVGISRACVAWQANPYQYQRHDPRRYDMLLMDVDANVGIGYRFHAMRELALGGRACCVGFVHILDDCLRLAKRWDDEAIARHEPRFHRSEALKALTLSEADGMSKFNWQVCYSILGMREQYDVARRTLATKKPNTGSDSVDKPLVTDGTVYGMRAKGMRTQQAIIDALKQVTRHDGDADDDAMDCGTEGTNQDGADGSTDICILINTVTNDIADEIAGTVSCSVKTVRRHLDTIRQTNEARQKREAAIGSVRKRQGNGKGVAVTVWEAIRP